MKEKFIERADTRVHRVGFNVALYRWTESGSIGASIKYELESLDHRVISLSPDQPIPDNVDFVFTYAPYARWMPIARRVQQLPAGKRPLLIHWNTEGLPTANVPLVIQQALGLLRSHLDEALSRRKKQSTFAGLNRLMSRRMLRYRYLGDYLRVQRSDIPFLLADISSIYCDRMQKLGVPAVHVPYGSSSLWHRDLGIERDIDVLWIGSHGSGHRSRNLARMSSELSLRGIHLRMVDGRSEPFVHGAARTELLNRTKIVLNLLRTPYDDNTLRMFIVMPNKAMVISEPIMKHNDLLVPGVHFVEAPLDDLAGTIAHYLANPSERESYIRAAHHLTTEQATMRCMLRKILAQSAARLPAHKAA